MKEEWKVYIRGNKDRGEEVIKVLEDCGASNSCGYIGDYDAALYFINHNGIIDSTRDYNAEFAKIIMDNYHELHLPEKWKDGDILINKNADYKFCVFDDYLSKTGSGNELFFFHCEVASHKGESYLVSTNRGRFHDVNDYRLATPQEVEQFYEAIHEHCKDWDAENKQLVNLKWKPKEGDDYWTVIVGIANKLKLTWFGTKADEARYKLGNCFKTREEAEVMAEKVKNLFLQNHEKTKENS